MARIASAAVEQTASQLRQWISWLDDPTAADQPLHWLRNGTTGKLHIQQGCTRFRPRPTAVTVTATLNEALNAPICEVCAPQPLADAGVLEALRAADHVEQLLTQITCDMRGDLPLEVIHRYLRALENVDRLYGTLGGHLTGTQPISRWREEQQRRADELLPTLRCRLTFSLDGFTTQMVVDLLRAQGPPLAATAAGSWADQLLGPGSRRSRHRRLQTVWLEWLDTRGDQTPATVQQLLADDELQQLSQLLFPTDRFVAAGELLDQVRAVWRTKVDELAEQLQADWSATFDRLHRNQSAAVVGVRVLPYGGIPSDTVRGVLVALDADTRPGATSVVAAPEVVALWLTTVGTRGSTLLTQMSVPVSVPDTGCDGAVLETAAALWQPHVDGAPYQCLDDSLRAASQLTAA